MTLTAAERCRSKDLFSSRCFSNFASLATGVEPPGAKPGRAAQTAGSRAAKKRVRLLRVRPGSSQGWRQVFSRMDQSPRPRGVGGVQAGVTPGRGDSHRWRTNSRRMRPPHRRSPHRASEVRDGITPPRAPPRGKRVRGRGINGRCPPGRDYRQGGGRKPAET